MVPGVTDIVSVIVSIEDATAIVSDIREVIVEAEKQNGSKKTLGGTP